MKKVISLFLAVLMLFVFESNSMANGLSLNSIGSRQLGMGGAFVGLANDATALYWNPAGLAGLNSSILVFATDIIPMGTYKNGPVDAKMATNHYIAPNAFFNYSSGNLALAFGVYIPAGLGSEWDPTDFGIPASANVEFLTKIAAITFSPGIAYKVSNQFSVGLAVNVTYAMFDMKQPLSQGAALGIPVQQFSEESNGLGFGATLGLKYSPSEVFSIGATVRLATKVAMSGTAKNGLFPKLPNIPAAGVATGPGESDFDRDVTWPMWIAGGIAYKPMPKLTLVLDGQLSQWSELDVLVAEYKEAYWKAAMKASGNDEFKLDWKDAVQIRFGAEYEFSNAVTGRLGFYTDPAPAPDETLNILFPSSTNKVVTGGLTYTTGKVAIIAGAEYLMGTERDVKQGLHNMGGKHQLDIFAVSLGFGYSL